MEGIWTCIFLAHRWNGLSCVCPLQGLLLPENVTIGMACCTWLVSLRPGPVAVRQYDRPPISRGDDVIVLASNHASISRITPESCLGALGSGCTEGEGEARSMLIGIAGTSRGVLPFSSAWIEGAVRGRRIGKGAWQSALCSDLFNVWRVVVLRSCRWNHFFGRSSLLLGAGKEVWVVVVGMLAAFEGTARRISSTE